MPELRAQEDLKPRSPLTAPPVLGGSGGAVATDAAKLARDDLRRQIGALERRLGELFASAFPRAGIEWRVGAVGGPRVLGVAELERVRDALVVRLREAQAELGRRAEAEEANRALIESMIAEPEKHRWVRVSNEDIGEAECRHWHSRPRWGILGMLLGWWRLKLSSGCPLAKGERPFPLASKKKSRKGGQRKPPPPQPKAERRGGGAKRQAAVASAPAGRRRGAADEGRPEAPWGSFPLVEVMTLIGVILLILGFFVVKGDQGAVMVVVGVALASLAGLELAIREHLAGYRSHTMLLSGFLAAIVLAALFYLAPDDVPVVVRLAIAGIVFAGTARILMLVFQRRAGVTYKLR